MAADELTKALLLEEVSAPGAVAEALLASVNGGVPLLQALVDSGAATPDLLARYFARSVAPYLRQVIPHGELVDRLPLGLCARLLAVPVRLDAITGTVDVVVVDPADPHPAAEIAFHLGAPVRLVRAPLAAIEEALRRLRMRPRGAGPTTERSVETGERPTRGDEEPLWNSRPRGARPPANGANAGRRQVTLPPPEPALSGAIPSERDVPPRRGGLVIESDSVPPDVAPPTPKRIRTPPWGTPIHTITNAMHAPVSEPPGAYGSEIPIPLTRKTMGPAPMPGAPSAIVGALHPAAHLRNPVSGGTQRPAGMINPMAAGLGEGYAFDATGLRDVVEKSATAHGAPPGGAYPASSFIPGPPPLPGIGQFGRPADVPAADPRALRPVGPKETPAAAPQLPFPEMTGVLAALRHAGSRDEILELVLMGARMVALKVALFVVKKGGYLGWLGTPEFADRAALQSILIPLEANSIFDRAVREDLYLGPIRHDEVHAPLLRVMKSPSRDVAAVPIRVSGKTAVVILADELGDTMLGTRRLEELARAGGDAFARIVRTRR